MLAMVKDAFANYVVQKLLDIANDEQRELLISKIKPHIPSLRKYTYGKHIITRIEKMGKLPQVCLCFQYILICFSIISCYIFQLYTCIALSRYITPMW